MKKLTLTGVAFMIGMFALHAQEQDVRGYTDSIVTPQFFIAVIAGVLLALGFQFIFTALSVALGITAVGDIKEKYAHNKAVPGDNKNNDDEDDGMSTGTMVTTGFGLWSIITVGLSLFGATALAINLSLITSNVISITLGLVIWATFFILLFYLESRIVNTVVGGLINTATSGLRASGEAVKQMFSTSEEQQLTNVAEKTVDKVKHDFQASFDPHYINDAIDEFFTRMDRSVPSYDKLKNDLQAIVEESSQEKANALRESAEKQQQSGGGNQTKWMAIESVLSKAISKGDNGDTDKTEQLKKLKDELKAAYDEGGTNEEKLEKAVAKLTPAEEEQIQGYIKKMKELITETSSQDIESGKLKEQIMEVIKNPEVETNKLLQRIEDLDRETIISFLADNTALKKDQIENYADKIEETIEKIKNELSGSNGEGSSAAEDKDLKEKLEIEVFKFMNHTGNSDIDFSMLTSFLQNKFGGGSGSNDTLDKVKNRLKNFDKDSLKAAVFNNTNIEQKDLDKVVDSIEDARTKVLDKIQEIEDEANRQIENAKRKAVIQTEHARKNAAAAAWWLVISAVLSAGAAIGGSLVAMS